MHELRDVRAPLRDLLALHDVSVETDAAWLRLPRGCRARAFWVDRPGGGGQLDVAFSPWPGTQIVESFAGAGESIEAQQADAWRRFVDGSLHVLLTSLLYRDDVPVEMGLWDVGGVPRAITLGPTLTRGDLPALPPWRETLRDVIERSAIPTGLHWVRLFADRHEGRKTVEILLDNVAWPEAEAAVRALDWPDGAPYYSVRLFLTIQGGLDVGRAVGALIEGASLEDADLVERMVASGIEPRDAMRLVAMIPVAFGRVLLEGSGLRLSPWAQVVSGADDRPRLLRLADEPIFTEATWLASQPVFTRDEFLAVALRSPEVALAQDADEATEFGPTTWWEP